MARSASGGFAAAFSNFSTALATDVRSSIDSTMGSLGSIDLGGVGDMAMAMASDPHTMLAMASVIPGLGEIAAAADVALYLYEGDSANAALAAAMFIPGGALLALGGAAVLGAKGARAAGKAMTLMAHSNSGARAIAAATSATSRVMSGLRTVGSTAKRLVSAAGSRIKGWTRGGEKGIAGDADVWRVPGSVPETRRTIGATEVPRFDRSQYSRFTSADRQGALQKSPTCPYCGRAPSTEADHISSVKRDWVNGGYSDERAVRSARVNRPENLIGACKSCNARKGAREIGHGATQWWPPAWSPEEWFPIGGGQ
jgi:5-methylcytosine-specific restriction endonuclease McrA